MKFLELTLFWNEEHYFEEKVKSSLAYADRILIAESRESFSGLVSRPLKVPRLLEKLAPTLRSRVDFIEVDLSSHKNKSHYDREIIVREAPWHYAVSNGLVAKDDIVIAQDFDEFFHPQSVDALKRFLYWRPWRSWTHLKYRMSYYYLNYKNVYPFDHANWTLPVAFRAGPALKKSDFLVDRLRRKKRGAITSDYMGWHHSYLGGVQFIEEKLKSFAHASDSMVQVLTRADIESRLRGGNDLFGRDLRFEAIHYEAQQGIPALLGRKDLMLEPVATN